MPETTLSDDGPPRLNRREIAASGLGVSPVGIAAFEALQNAAFDSNPANTEIAQQTAESAQSSASAAQSSASAAQSDATAALANAATANANAETRVKKSLGPIFSAPTGTLSRASYPSYTAPTISPVYTQAEVQALADAVQALSRAFVAVVTDLRANEALKP